LRLAFARDLLGYPEFLGIVDNGFDPKNEPRLVIYLEPVLFDTMFHSRSTRATADEAREIGDDLAFELAVQFTPKEVHDLLGAKAQRAVTE